MNTSDKFLTEERRQQRRKTPSFSSSLLDAIYRSIDESKGCDDDEEPDIVLCKEVAGTMRKKQIKTSFKRNNADLEDGNEIGSLRRAMMIEKWMENRSNSSRTSRVLNSASSSSDSSCGGVFSASETESSYRERSKSSSVKQRSRQVQTCFSSRSEMCENAIVFDRALPNREGRFMRTKSRALKIYGDLKKVKQPISPGGRISNFLNSIFNSRNAKNTKPETMEDFSSVRKSRSVKGSTASTGPSASSFSRSCLIKTPSSRGELKSDALKRTVRFSPVVDEDSRPCGHKGIIYGGGDPKFMAITIGTKNAESTKLENALMAEKHNAEESYFERNYGDFEIDNKDDDEVIDDDESCSSSDLFELENIGAVGIDAFAEELPVYGTTSLKTNHAIAKGFHSLVLNL